MVYYRRGTPFESAHESYERFFRLVAVFTLGFISVALVLIGFYVTVAVKDDAVLSNEDIERSIHEWQNGYREDFKHYQVTVVFANDSEALSVITEDETWLVSWKEYVPLLFKQQLNLQNMPIEPSASYGVSFVVLPDNGSNVQVEARSIDLNSLPLYITQSIPSTPVACLEAQGFGSYEPAQHACTYWRRLSSICVAINTSSFSFAPDILSCSRSDPNNFTKYEAILAPSALNLTTNVSIDIVVRSIFDPFIELNRNDTSLLDGIQTKTQRSILGVVLVILGVFLSIPLVVQLLMKILASRTSTRERSELEREPSEGEPQFDFRPGRENDTSYQTLLSADEEGIELQNIVTSGSSSTRERSRE